MVPKLLNYIILTPYFTRLFRSNIAEYGKITELYAYIVFLMILLTYGMETAYFRFATSDQRSKVFSNIMASILFTTGLFLALVLFFTNQIADVLKFTGEPYFIQYLAGILAVETLSAVPFARLRIENKARKFAILKMVLVVSNIAIMLFFYNVLPALGLKEIILNSNGFVSARFIFLSNFLSSLLVLAFLLPQFKDFRFRLINFSFLRSIYIYGLPLLVAGLAGVVNETLDRSIYKHIFSDTNKALYELGIYGANYKLASVILIVVQMFRYAAEPFFFNYEKEKDSRQRYAQIMSVFVGITVAMALGILLFMEVAKYFVASEFYAGLTVVPLIAFSYVLYGMLFNLSTWYKLSNHTYIAIFITIIGAAITLFINLLYVPKFGYMACAVAHVISYSVMVILSYWLCMKYYPIPYDMKKISSYLLLGFLLFLADKYIEIDWIILKYVIKILLLGIFFTFVAWKENVFKLLR